MTFIKGYTPWNKGKRGIMNCGKSNGRWKGNKAEYSARHQWKIRISGRPPFCEHCGKKGKYFTHFRLGKETRYWSIHWANKSGKYLREVNDWLGLCQFCHRIYDWSEEQKTCAFQILQRHFSAPH